MTGEAGGSDLIGTSFLMPLLWKYLIKMVAPDLEYIDETCEQVLDKVLPALQTHRRESRQPLQTSTKSGSINSTKLATAQKHLDVAQEALTNGLNAFSRLAPQDVPAKALREGARVVGAEGRQIYQLAKGAQEAKQQRKRKMYSEVEAEGEHCEHSREILWRYEVAYVARDIVAGPQPEQLEKIREYMKRT